MGQTEVYNYLKGRKTGATPKQISKAVKVDVSSVNTSLPKLERRGSVRRIETKKEYTNKRTIYVWMAV